MNDKIDQRSLELAALWAAVLHGLRTGFGPLLSYGILFKIVAAAVLAPLFAVFFNRLITTTGRVSVTNTELASFFLSLPGVVGLLLVAATTLLLVFAEQSGLVMISYAAEHGQRLAPLRALRLMLLKLARLLGVALAQVLIVVVCALPFLAIAGLVYSLLLSGHDINFYLAQRPPEFIVALVIAGLLALGLAIVLAVLFVRWAVVLPVCLFEGRMNFAALRRSRALVTGYSVRVGLVILGWAAIVALVATVTAWLLDGFAEILLAYAGNNADFIIVTVAGLMVLFTLEAALFSFIGFAGYSLLTVHLYQRLCALKSEQPADQLGLLQGRPDEAGARVWRWPVVWGAVAVLAVATIGVAYGLVEEIDLGTQVQVTAHRGSSRTAPENSLSAVQQAIDDGAHYAEIDVQETGDGVIVVVHDTDLMRVAGLNKKIWEVNYAEIADLDAGSWFSAEFKGEPIPTLEQMIDLAGDRIKLNVELKYNGHDEKLAERVIEILEKKNFIERCVMTSLEYDGLMRVRELNQKIRIGHIVTVSVGDITRQAVDFLSLNTGLVNADSVTNAGSRGLGVHVWTVNDAPGMGRMIDLGVENIITDEPTLLVQILGEYAELSDTERLLLRFSHWLRR